MSQIDHIRASSSMDPAFGEEVASAMRRDYTLGPDEYAYEIVTMRGACAKEMWQSYRTAVRQCWTMRMSPTETARWCVENIFGPLPDDE